MAMVKVDITRVDAAMQETSRRVDYVAREEPLHIFLNRFHYATILCSPKNRKELGVGYLLSTGILKSVAEIEETELKNGNSVWVTVKPSVDFKKRLKLLGHVSRVILSACGSPSTTQFAGLLPTVKSKLKVKAEVVLNAVKNLNLEASTFRKTGGVHAAALCTARGNSVAFAEDVGRHNAVDKVIGIGALNRLDFNECFLALSGRLTADIVTKAARMGLPIVASLAAAVDSGIEAAKNANVTLVGFARSRRMNVYSFPERILV